MNLDPKSDLIPPAFIARRLGVARTLPYKWIKLGLLEAVELPSCGTRPLIRVPRESYERFVASFKRYEHRMPRKPRQEGAA